MHQHEITVNTNVAHPLMRRLELPYPLLVGKVNAGEWSSMVPDRLEFEGRLGVPVGADLQEAREALEAVVGFPLEWSGGAFAPGETSADHPWARTVRGALSDELGYEAPIAGVPWGADMRLFTARGIPAVMVGTTDIEKAHAVDESVSHRRTRHGRPDDHPGDPALLKPKGARPLQIRPASRAACSAASSLRSTRSSPRSQKDGSARSTPTIAPSSSGDLEPPALSSSTYLDSNAGPSSS